MSEEREGIEFTINEQNCLALVCETMAKLHHAVNTLDRMPNDDEFDELTSVVENFPNINWGNLYDKFHRQGKNR